MYPICCFARKKYSKNCGPFVNNWNSGDELNKAEANFELSYNMRNFQIETFLIMWYERRPASCTSKVLS